MSHACLASTPPAAAPRRCPPTRRRAGRPSRRLSGWILGSRREELPNRWGAKSEKRGRACLLYTSPSPRD
eukprot:3958104-Alexandrium_andersonii.AAC.1